MRLELLVFFAFYVKAVVINSPSRIRRSATMKTIEDKLDDGYELLKNEPENTVEEINEEMDTVLFQGDMLLTKEQAQEIVKDTKEDDDERSKRQAYVNKEYPKTIWQNGQVYYSFYPNATEHVKRQFKKATKAWQRGTCLNFNEDDTAEDRIGVFTGSQCFSSVGRIGGLQNLSLMYGCFGVGAAAHEIGHALGLFHTQSRHDRNKFIKVFKKNIKDGWESQFDKETTDTNNNYKLTYDYGSLMHYGRTLSSKNGQPTMVALDDNYSETLGSQIISFYDRLMINHHYKCLGKCDKKTSVNCANGGYPNPKHCSKCVCPSGYGGTLCKRRPDGCGMILNATTEFKTLTDTLGKKNVYFPQDDFTMCNYWITAPKGSKIEVVLDSFPNDFAKDGCVYGGVEIKAGKDKRLTGYRFCSSKSFGKSLISKHNVVPVITFTRYGEVTTVLRYRIVSA